MQLAGSGALALRVLRAATLSHLTRSHPPIASLSPSHHPSPLWHSLPSSCYTRPSVVLSTPVRSELLHALAVPNLPPTPSPAAIGRCRHDALRSFACSTLCCRRALSMSRRAPSTQLVLPRRPLQSHSLDVRPLRRPSLDVLTPMGRRGGPKAPARCRAPRPRASCGTRRAPGSSTRCCGR